MRLLCRISRRGGLQLKPIYDIILREWNGQWMPLIRVHRTGTDWQELFRGEYKATPEAALAKAMDIMMKIKAEDD